MAAPILRHYVLGTMAAATATDVFPVVPAGRALVVSKAVVACALTSGTVSFDLRTAGDHFLIRGLVLSPGEAYTETGLVLPAGDNLRVWVGVADGVDVHVFGQEVDN